MTQAAYYGRIRPVVPVELVHLFRPKSTGRTEVLILDDWGLVPIAVAESPDLLEVIDDRSQTRSTIVASQLPRETWYSAIGDATVADAILDRLVHGAHKLLPKGESMRKIAKSQPVTAQTQ